MSLSVSTFERELYSRLGREYRIRWSTLRETWMIEQQVSRAHLPESLPRSVQWSEDWKRASDGYALVVEVSPSPTMKCGQCKTRLKVPELHWGEVKCETCRESKNYNTAIYYVAYFPLCERLLSHLESTSPKRGWEWVKKMISNNATMKEKQDQALSDHLDAGVMDYRHVIADTARIGYGNGPAKFGRI